MSSAAQSCQESSIIKSSSGLYKCHIAMASLYAITALVFTIIGSLIFAGIISGSYYQAGFGTALGILTILPTVGHALKAYVYSQASAENPNP